MRNYLLHIVQSQNGDKPEGVYSVCSSNKYVLKAAMLQTIQDGGFLLVEPTANQVNQYGGYTGMTPEDFVHFLFGLADEAGFKKENLILGGDHLGPNPWRSESSDQAMKKSKILVRDYVKAGFTKIHLDTSMPCADDAVDPGTSMPDEMVAGRAAELCQIAEEVWQNNRHSLEKPVYVIGTEVPVPGGAEGSLHNIQVTSVQSAEKTFETTRRVFLERGLDEAWDRVIAQVVQPGVEFDNSTVIEYAPEKASDLSQFIKGYKNIVFEAHSTDYQPFNCLKNLVRDGFAILKVGPWLTFSFREAVFGLSYIEEELLSRDKSVKLSRIREVLDREMVENPKYWESYYDGDDVRKQYLRKYSYSDRSRYYWQTKPVVQSLSRLFKNLNEQPPPIPLISQYLPEQCEAIRQGLLENDPEQMVLHKIQMITKNYSRATEK